MTLANEPYFLKNEKWYFFDEDECRYFLTDDAPPEAVDSYKEYYDLIDGSDKAS